MPPEICFTDHTERYIQWLNNATAEEINASFNRLISASLRHCDNIELKIQKLKTELNK